MCVVLGLRLGHSGLKLYVRSVEVHGWMWCEARLDHSRLKLDYVKGVLLGQVDGNG